MAACTLGMINLAHSCYLSVQLRRGFPMTPELFSRAATLIPQVGNGSFKSTHFRGLFCLDPNSMICKLPPCVYLTS
jgi:hypothetical protein